ncbi:hypothetical protein SSP35_17_01250 [Streptomyces sp. NBRC 110611]|nr:hypothetical protein SSP35_17_01250 [Streptomyces sp. NBRC 110611]
MQVRIPPVAGSAHDRKPDHSGPSPKEYHPVRHHALIRTAQNGDTEATAQLLANLEGMVYRLAEKCIVGHHRGHLPPDAEAGPGPGRVSRRRTTTWGP